MNLVRWYMDEESACGLREGELVRITAAVPSRHNGWNNVWDRDMNATVGQVGVVASRSSHGTGITVRVDGHLWQYPFYVLERVTSFPEVVDSSSAHEDWAPLISPDPVVLEEMLSGTVAIPPALQAGVSSRTLEALRGYNLHEIGASFTEEQEQGTGDE